MSDICVSSLNFTSSIITTALTKSLTHSAKGRSSGSLTHTQAFAFPIDVDVANGCWRAFGLSLVPSPRLCSLAAFLLGTPLCLLAGWLAPASLAALSLPRCCHPPPVSSQSPQPQSLADCHPTLTLSTTSHHQSPSPSSTPTPTPPTTTTAPPHALLPPPRHSHTRLRDHRKASAPLLSTPSG